MSLPPITKPDMIGSGHNSPEAWMMFEQLGHVGNTETGEGYQRVQKTNESIRVDDTGTYVYVGYAETGTAESVASWKIFRVTTTNPVAIMYADGDSFYNNIWDNRASLTYL